MGLKMKKWIVHVFLMTIAVILFSCGKLETIVPGPGDLSIELQLPSSEDPGYFWDGVAKKTLRLKSESKDQEIDWSLGSRIELEVSEGDVFEFSGFDTWGNQVVRGQATVGSEKRVIIPIEKVL